MINKYALGLLLIGLPFSSFAGVLLEKTFQHGGITREYEIYLPDNLSNKAPLVFVLHGRTSRNKWIRNNSQMNDVADQGSFAVCYPQGTSAKMPGIDEEPKPHWNVHLTYMDVDDVGFLPSLAVYLQSEHSLDSERTFVAGHSNGAHMAYALGVERPDIFRAIASVAGWMSYDAWQNRKNAKPIPIMQIHGLADPVNPIEGYGGDPNHQGLGWGGALHVDEVVKFWVELNECSEKVTDILTPKTTAYRYTGGKNNNEVWYYKIADWPHIWPANGHNPNNVSKEGVINASEEIWKFFSKFPVLPSSTVENSLALPPKPQLDSRAAGPRFPNVVTLLVDDLGYRDIGCYGGPAKTPVLDKLAAGGVRFTDFHSGAPVCSPSRATFLTGRHHIRAGVYSVINEKIHRMHLLPSEVTLSEVLRGEGYVTAHFGKWHLGTSANNREYLTPADHGFDYWFGPVNGAQPSHKDPVNFLRNGKPVGPMKGYSCQLVVDEAIDWLDKKRDAGEPFFLNLWFNEPHAVIAAPDEIVSRYGALNDQAAIYNGTIDNTDRAIGRLVAKLEQLGELDNTIIHYSSDNGSYRQDRSGKLRGKKGSHHEGGHRVPGIFYWRGKIPGGHVEKEPAGAVDLLPTICGLLGIDKPKGVFLDGSDLTPLLIRTGSFERHQPLFWMNGSTMVLRMGDHTLLAPSTARLPFDNAKANRLLQQTKLALGDDLEKELGGLDLRSRMFNGRFANREANRLRDEFRAMFYFNEALIPLMKKGGVNRVQLYDLASDLSQERDIASQNPGIVARMKKQANLIYQSVMADAPEWITPEEISRTATPESPSKRDDLLTRIDRNPLPEGYHASSHQRYVDKVMAGLKPEQRARVGQLWKEKLRLDPGMPNRGASFVRILTHVAEGTKGPAASPARSGK
jgi:arylsulfatase A